MPRWGARHGLQLTSLAPKLAGTGPLSVLTQVPKGARDGARQEAHSTGGRTTILRRGRRQNLVEKLYGPQGPAWGTKLTQIEDVFLEIREMLTEKMLDETLARQAAAGERPAPYRACPGCQAPLPCADANPRILKTRAGEAEWPEPEAYCDRCRRSFFPSVPEPGH